MPTAVGASSRPAAPQSAAPPNDDSASAASAAPPRPRAAVALGAAELGRQGLRFVLCPDDRERFVDAGDALGRPSGEAEHARVEMQERRPEHRGRLERAVLVDRRFDERQAVGRGAAPGHRRALEARADGSPHGEVVRVADLDHRAGVLARARGVAEPQVDQAGVEVRVGDAVRLTQPLGERHRFGRAARARSGKPFIHSSIPSTT